MLRLNDFPVALKTRIPDEAFAWRNDYRVYKTCRQATLLSIHDHGSYWNTLRDQPNTKMFGIYALVTKPRLGTRTTPFNQSSDVEDCKIPVGVCGLTSLNHINQTAEFSLYIAPGYQGKGYAKAALKTLLWVGFNQLNLNRIWGETFATNVKAVIMFGQLGFRKEGELLETYYKEGKFINSYMVGMLRREFNEHHPNLYISTTSGNPSSSAPQSETETNSGKNDPISSSTSGCGTQNEATKA